MDNEIIIHLSEVPIEEGDFRTENAQDQKFRTLLVDRGDELVTTVNIVNITHGMLEGGKHPATLLVFDLRFVATGGRRFVRATTTFRFQGSTGEASLEPEVHSIAPSGKFAINKTERVQTIKRGVNANFNSGQAPVSVEAGVMWETQEIKSKEYYTALSGMRRLIRKGWVGKENAAIWKLEENAHKKDGIPTFMRAAVLLKRLDDNPFSFMIKVQTEVDIIGQIRTFFGLEKKDPIDPVQIDPAYLPQVASLDSDQHNCAELDRIFQEVAGAMVATVEDGTHLVVNDE